MKKFGKLIVKLRIPILILSVLLLIPAAIGYFNTKVNYDILYYLPGDIDTMKGQDILLDDFGKGAYAMVVVDGMNKKNVSELVKKVEKVDHVASVISYNGIVGDGVPSEILPDKFRSYFENDDSGATLFAIFFDDTTSSTETMDAIEELRDVTDKQCYIAGMSAVVTDTKSMSEKETPIYVLVAVLLVCVVLAIFMDSFLVPVLFMVSIGMAIVYNLGTNIFLGEVSYITKALAAVLQLGVTLDYSIFLWHSYKEEKEKNPGDHKEAMAVAIGNTLTSVVGSSITTVAGFIALCFMSFTLGLDLGIVMAKGVIFGVIGCVTILPSLLLIFDKVLEKTKHRSIIPKMDKLASGIVKIPAVFIVLFVIIIVPAIYCYNKTEVYYDMASTLPDDIDYVIATSKLDEKFDMSNVHMVLADANMEAKDANAMMKEMESVDGVNFAMGFNSLVGTAIPEEIIPDDLKSILKGDKYQLILVSSAYKTATDEVNDQIDELNDIIKKYDENGMLIGEAPCTKDLITVTDHDFQVVNIISIAAIFIIILIVLKSISLPVILVAVIQFAIFINLGIPYITGTTLPFIAPICISTIQLGSTVDYAILMTTRYKRERSRGADRKASVTTALATSIPSILVSALGFFAATFGVAVYSEIDIISSLCVLMARGALISMASVILILPSFLLVFDGLITHTSMGFNVRKKKA